jgi:hypothetical protein
MRDPGKMPWLGDENREIRAEKMQGAWGLERVMRRERIDTR